MKNKANNRVVNHWVEINNMISRQKHTSLISFGLSAVLALCLVLSSMKDPIVAITDGSQSLYVSAKRQNTKITDNDIIETVRRFIKLRYEWSELNPDQIYSSIRPVSTEGVSRKILMALKKEIKSFDNKPVEQYTANIEVKVSKDRIVATFYRVIVVLGAPIAAKANLSFQLMHGKKTYWNPAGLYVNGVTIHEAS